jgi:hypothetical protein
MICGDCAAFDGDSDVWYVEKLLHRRKSKKHAGGHEYLVKWNGWPDKYNSWVMPPSHCTHHTINACSRSPLAVMLCCAVLCCVVLYRSLRHTFWTAL